jgi:heme A synthase
VISLGELVHVIVYLIVIGLVIWLLFWLIDYIAPPEPFHKIANVILVIVGVLLVIGVLMSLIGHPLVSIGP